MSLLSYDEALSRVRGRLEPRLRVESVELLAALKRVLAEPIHARLDHPPFDNSGVDGYALAEAPSVDRPIPVLGEIVAGGPTVWLAGGCSLRVLTGAALPPNTYAVVMQEDVEPLIGRIKINASVSADENVRRRGEDFSQGDLLLDVGQPLNSGAIALLASQGVTAVSVFLAPTIGVLTTGDELVSIDVEPSGSQLRDSNQELLAAGLLSLGVRTIVRWRVRDDPLLTAGALSELASACDLVIVSGGASVGDHDYLRSSVEKLGRVEFHGISVRPGKPTLFGFIGETPLLGLPGNPSSSFVCFHLFVGEMVRRMSGHSSPEPVWIPATFRGDISPSPRDHFERVLVKVSDGVLYADRLPSENSQGLKACALCTGLARIPGGTESRSVNVLLID